MGIYWPHLTLLSLVETGSWDPSLGVFIPTRLLGSSQPYDLGKSRNKTQCVIGFDQASYVAGISSNVWNGLNCSLFSLSIRLFTFDHIIVQ